MSAAVKKCVGVAILAGIESQARVSRSGCSRHPCLSQHSYIPVHRTPLPQEVGFGVPAAAIGWKRRYSPRLQIGHGSSRSGRPLPYCGMTYSDERKRDCSHLWKQKASCEAASVGCPPPLQKEGEGRIFKIPVRKSSSFRTSLSCFVRKSKAAVNGCPLSALRFAPLLQRGSTAMSLSTPSFEKGGWGRI